MKRILVGLFILATLAGCDRRHSEAIVLGKEHIAAQAPTPTPPVNQAPADANTLPDAANSALEAESEPREMAPDEIAVDGVVMKAALRGTDRDPRATTHEQWRVKVRTTDNGRTFDLYADRAGYEKIHIGDRVKVSYRVGKYTGTVWAAELE